MWLFVLNQASKAESVSLILLLSHQFSAIKKLNSVGFYQLETWKKFHHLILEESFHWNKWKRGHVLVLFHQVAQHHCKRKNPWAVSVSQHRKRLCIRRWTLQSKRSNRLPLRTSILTYATFILISYYLKKKKKIRLSGFLEKKWEIIPTGNPPVCSEFRRHILLRSSLNKYCKANQLFLGL